MDALVAAAGSHRVIMENSQVRVLDVLIEPGTREPEQTNRPGSGTTRAKSCALSLPRVPRPVSG
jgi:hypothetical protein